MKTIIVAFHIGRGGKFNSSGHVSFLGENEISKFTENLFTNYENTQDFAKRFGYDSTSDNNQKCILDLITDEEFDELEEKFGITTQMLGKRRYYDATDNSVGLTVDEANSGIGKINIDNEYDTTYTRYIEDCDQDELQIIQDSDIFKSYELQAVLSEPINN